MKKLLIILLLLPFAALAQTPDSLSMPDKYKVDSVKVNGRWNYTFGVPEIPALQLQTAILESQLSQLINTPPPSASIPVLIPVMVSGNAYTIKPTDHANTIVCSSSCTVTVPTGLFTGFYCSVIRKGGEVTISGNVKSYSNWRRIKWPFTDVTILFDGTDVILRGNLKQL